MKKTALCCAFFAFSALSWSQQALVLTEDKVRELAVGASNALQETRASAAASQAQAAAVASRKKTQVELQANVTQRSSVPEFHLPATIGGNVLYTSIETTAGSTLTVVQPLDAALSYRTRAAQRQAQGAQAEVSRTQLDVVLKARLSFWQAILAASAVTVAEKEFRRAEQNLADTVLLEEAGLATRAAVLTAQAHRDQTWVALLRARSAAALELVSLRSLLQLPAEQPLQLQPTPALPPPPPPLSELWTTALAQRPELAALRHQAEALRLQTEAERAEKKPRFSLLAQYDWSRPNPRYFPLENRWHGTWAAGFLGTIKVWDGGEAQAKANAAAAQYTATLAHLKELERLVTLEVEHTRQELEDALALIPAASTALAAARERQQAVRETYLAGLARVEDLLAAESALARAEFEQEQSRVRAWMAQARLERSLGQ
ncbi:MAG: hypothetical protein KatS3mg007_1628 [Thermoanaerobaculum sp.]|nr:MAG: hypothetical protein KatS3mg007_1628 [Thermoanaerobaculum sp.]